MFHLTTSVIEVLFSKKMLHLTFYYLQKNLQDFDMRTALHRAAMHARILSVSYLLGIAANPNLKDRWGNTALDVALQGESSYHMYKMFWPLLLFKFYALWCPSWFSDFVLDLYSTWGADRAVFLAQQENKIWWKSWILVLLLM